MFFKWFLSSVLFMFLKVVFDMFFKRTGFQWCFNGLDSGFEWFLSKEIPSLFDSRLLLF